MSMLADSTGKLIIAVIVLVILRQVVDAIFNSI